MGELRPTVCTRSTIVSSRTHLKKGGEETRMAPGSKGRHKVEPQLEDTVEGTRTQFRRLRNSCTKCSRIVYTRTDIDRGEEDRGRAVLLQNAQNKQRNLKNGNTGKWGIVEGRLPEDARCKRNKTLRTAKPNNPYKGRHSRTCTTIFI